MVTFIVYTHFAISFIPLTPLATRMSVLVASVSTFMSVSSLMLYSLALACSIGQFDWLYGSCLYDSWQVKVDGWLMCDIAIAINNMSVNRLCIR